MPTDPAVPPPERRCGTCHYWGPVERQADFKTRPCTYLFPFWMSPMERWMAADQGKSCRVWSDAAKWPQPSDAAATEALPSPGVGAVERAYNPVPGAASAIERQAEAICRSKDVDGDWFSTVKRGDGGEILLRLHRQGWDLVPAAQRLDQAVIALVNSEPFKAFQDAISRMVKGNRADAV